MVKQTRAFSPANPPPVGFTQLQSWGHCKRGGLFKCGSRITIPEEVSEIANLAVLHDVKGITHFVLPTFWSGSDTDSVVFANLWDEDWVPFDAPYEDYVYARNHDRYADPDTLRPFCTNLPDESLYTDPFRELPPRPEDHTNYHKYLEYYYQWKYAPYARNYNAIGDINNQFHIIGNEMLNLWRTCPAMTISPDSSSCSHKPEHATFSPMATQDIHLYLVNKDVRHSQMGFTVKVARPRGMGGPGYLPASLDTAHMLDLSKRHLIHRDYDSTDITFHTVLGAGEGKLVRLMQGEEIADAMVADPDIEFRLVSGDVISTAPQCVFGEGDTIELSAKVYNLGFNPVDICTVGFYDRRISPQRLIGNAVVNLPALAGNDTLPALVTAKVTSSTLSQAVTPHDIKVRLGIPQSIQERGGNNDAHMSLLVQPQDYATKVVHNPWDMTERQGPGQPSTVDIDSFKYFVETPDSISGVWEAKTVVGGTPDIFLHVTSPIVGSKYNQLSLRFLDCSSTPGPTFLKVSWLNTDVTSGSDSVSYERGVWNVEHFDFSGTSGRPDWRGKQVRAVWVRPRLLPGSPIRVAWAKLTTKP